MTSKQRKEAAYDLTLVIRDPSNSKLDYALPAARAEFLFYQGKLKMAQVYNGRWTFCTPDPYSKVL